MIRREDCLRKRRSLIDSTKGSPMNIAEWDPSDSGRLTEAYNAQAVEIPYDDYPVDPETLVDALSLSNSDFSDFSDGRIFVSENGGDPKGFIHVGTIPGDGDSGKDIV